MAPRPAEGTARIALFGAGTDAGARLRAELAVRRVAGRRVTLYGARPGETVISEYDGEARLLQEPDLDEIAGHDIVFVCEPGELAQALATRAGVAERLIDLTGTLATTMAHEPMRPPVAGGAIGVAHPLAIVLAELIAPLLALGVTRTATTILRPAADSGAEGLEELREQTLRLLRFEPPPTEVFGRQLAFNLIPQAMLPGGEGLEARVGNELRALIGPDSLHAVVAIVTVPIFHGHGICLLADGPGLSVEPVRRALADAGLILARGKGAATPIDAPEIRRTDVALLADDGPGSVRLWAIAAEASSAAARQALALAARRADL